MTAEYAPTAKRRLTTSQAARVLNCSARWVSEMHRRGRLEGDDTPLGVLFDAQQIERYATERARPGGGDAA